MSHKDPPDNNAARARAANQRYRIAHLEQRRKESRTYNANHRAELKIYAKARYAENAEKERAKRRNYHTIFPEINRSSDARRRMRRKQDLTAYLIHREKERARSKVYYQRYRKAILARQAFQRKNNPETVRAKNAHRRARIRGALATLTIVQWKAILVAYKHRCAYCGQKPKKLTQDHVIPLAKGGAHTADNIVPACLLCNSRKSTNPPPTLPPLRLLL